AVDLDSRYGSATQRRQKHATQRVAEGEAKATLERLGDQSGQSLFLRRELDLVRLDQFLPVFLDHVAFLPLPHHHPIVVGDLENRKSARWRLSNEFLWVRRGASCAGGSHCAGSVLRPGS